MFLMSKDRPECPYCWYLVATSKAVAVTSAYTPCETEQEAIDAGAAALLKYDGWDLAAVKIRATGEVIHEQRTAR